jgi:UDP-N-acetylglucosamine diphosphorylase / glucose-1-phosphate thymidylyltransferase / UDP-N-acetylgalactosamine diphosphorylase / glucosamine-1-phosphate N-acetyltransferase / galactosamine-1-phosphate N-acetyltransferase
MMLVAGNQIPYMHIQPANDDTRTSLHPFTRLRAAADVRVGIFSQRERCSIANGFSGAISTGTITIPANMLVSITGLIEAIKNNSASPSVADSRLMLHAADMVKWNDWALRQDFEWISTHGNSEPIPATVTVINPQQVFIEPGAKLQYCTINASNGPVYIGAGAEIMEGSFLRGPIAICSGALIKMGTKIYGATTIGPYSMAGGEIKNSILMGYSNKAHDGYLGDSVIGEWCNLGAGTSNSNIKNTAGEIRLYAENETYTAGNKCGLIMGDFSRSAINTSFNTGTVVGVSCNVFGIGLTPTYIPDFSWGLNGVSYREDEAVQDAKNWMKLKNKTMEVEQEAAFRALYQQLVKK